MYGVKYRVTEWSGTPVVLCTKLVLYYVQIDFEYVL